VLILVIFVITYYISKDTIYSKELENLLQVYSNETQSVKSRQFTDEIPLTNSTTPVWFWIDIPNAFPWRHCLQEYNNILTPLHCEEKIETQKFLLEALDSTGSENNFGHGFYWKTVKGLYIVPGRAVHEGVMKDTLVLNETIDREDYWTWTAEGQVQWSKGCKKCVTSVKENTPVTFTFCKQFAEDQNVEIGKYQEKAGVQVLSPLNAEKWKARQETMRNEFLKTDKVTVINALNEIDQDDLIHAGGFRGDDRRAAVFYVDKGKGAIANVKWWIYTWKFIGLNAAGEGFDLVMMVHPLAVENLPEECKEVTEDFEPKYGQAGECLYKPYVGRFMIRRHSSPVYFIF